MAHLNENQIKDYSGHKLSAAELLAFSDHLGTCDECRRQVENNLDTNAAFFSLRSELLGPEPSTAARGHLSIEQISDFVDGMPAGEERQAVNDHLPGCERCTLAVNDLRAFRNQVAPGLNREYRPASVASGSERWSQPLLALLPYPVRRGPVAFGSALAVLLLVLLAGLLVWQAQRKDTRREITITQPTPEVSPPVNSSTPPVEQSVVPVIAELNDGGGTGRITLDQQGKLSGVDQLPAAYQQMVKKALTDQRLNRSSLLKGLSRPASSLMGGSEQSERFSVNDPVGKVVQSDRPTFRWSRLPSAASYIVEVYDEQFNLVTRSLQLVDNSWTSPQTLKRGRIYSWQVKAQKDGQELTSPRPPAPQAKFRILDQATANELAQARRAYASSHLTLGLLYAQSGLLDEAEQEFRALQKANPDSPVVQELLRQVKKLRR